MSFRMSATVVIGVFGLLLDAVGTTANNNLYGGILFSPQKHQKLTPDHLVRVLSIMDTPLTKQPTLRHHFFEMLTTPDSDLAGVVAELAMASDTILKVPQPEPEPDVLLILSCCKP